MCNIYEMEPKYDINQNCDFGEIISKENFLSQEYYDYNNYNDYNDYNYNSSGNICNLEDSRKFVKDILDSMQ